MLPDLNVQTSNYKLGRPSRQSERRPNFDLMGTFRTVAGTIRQAATHGQKRDGGEITAIIYLERVSHFARRASWSRSRTLLGSGKSLPSQ